MFTEQQKQSLKRRLVNSLRTEREVCRIVIFGSFVNSNDPHDLDVAIFQDSDEKYLPLAMKYRRKTRDIARMIPMDILPLRAGIQGDTFLDEIDRGEVIYERSDEEVA
jgi:predicted nucleotidyltransferase